MKNWFTSDWHLGEDRIGLEEKKPNLFYRPFKSIQEQNRTIVDNFLTSGFQDGDELWHLGDVCYQVNNEVEDYLTLIRDEFPNSEFNLIIGNYDEDKLAFLGQFFDNTFKNAIVNLDGNIYLDHYPSNCLDELKKDTFYDFCITGHIHGLWKVQKKMINVGVDAWHFNPVSEKEIEFCMVACKKYYDKNVFPYD